MPVLERLGSVGEEGAACVQGTGLPLAGPHGKAFLLGEPDSGASLVTPWRRPEGPPAHTPSCSSERETRRDQEPCRGKPACGRLRGAAPRRGVGRVPRALGPHGTQPDPRRAAALSSGSPRAEAGTPPQRREGRGRRAAAGAVQGDPGTGWSQWSVVSGKVRKDGSLWAAAPSCGSAWQTGQESGQGPARSEGAVTGAVWTLLEGCPPLRTHSACPLRLLGYDRAL